MSGCCTRRRWPCTGCWAIRSIRRRGRDGSGGLAGRGALHPRAGHRDAAGGPGVSATCLSRRCSWSSDSGGCSALRGSDPQDPAARNCRTTPRINALAYPARQPALSKGNRAAHRLPLCRIVSLCHCLFPGFGQQCRPPSGEASSARERGGWRARGCRARDEGDPHTRAGVDRRRLIPTRHTVHPAACGRERDEARQGGVSRWRAGSLTVCPSGGSLR